MVLGVFDTFDELLNQLTGGDNDSKSKLDREQEELKEREAEKIKLSREQVRLQGELNENIITAVREGGVTVNNAPMYSASVNQQSGGSIGNFRDRTRSRPGR